MKTRATLKVINLGNGWIEGTYKGHFFQAKVFDQPSEYGINEGRVSKLTVCKGNVWDSKKVVFNFDRGMDIESPIGFEIADLFEQSK